MVCTAGRSEIILLTHYMVGRGAPGGRHLAFVFTEERIYVFKDICKRDFSIKVYYLINIIISCYKLKAR